MKLRKKDRHRLESILAKLKRGREYVMAESTALMRRTSLTSADVFTAPYFPGQAYHSVAKDIGSEWTLALTAIHELERALAEAEEVVSA
jgi:hypothetical protein